MRKWFAPEAADVRAAILSVAVSIVLGLWAAVERSVGLPHAIAITLVSAAALALLWNQWHQAFGARAKKMAANRNPADIEKLIREWLYEVGFQIKTEPDDKYEFRIRTTSTSGRHFTVVQTKGSPFVIVGADVTFEREGERDRLASSPRFIERLNLELARLGVESQPSPARPTTSVTITDAILFDESTTILTLLRSVHLVQRGINVVAALKALHLIAAAEQDKPR